MTTDEPICLQPNMEYVGRLEVVKHPLSSILNMRLPYYVHMITPSQTIILIPTYNEIKNICLTLKRLFAVSRDFHVLVLDDSSPDGTGNEVRKMQHEYPTLSLMERTSNKGFAQSYIDGFKKVCADNQYDVVITMDADFSHEPEEIPHLLTQIDKGADIVLGSRYAKNQAFPHISPWRRHLSRFANNYVRTILQLPITDCTSGFIAIKTSALRQLPFADLRTEGYGFLFELKYQAHQAKLKFAEHAVKWPERHQGASKMNYKRIFESALLPWKIKFAAGKNTKAISKPQ